MLFSATETLLPSEAKRNQNLKHVNNPVSKRNMESILQIMYFNARSVRFKLTDLHNLLYSVKGYFVVCITESWLSRDLNSGLLDPEGKYNIYRTDRNSSFAAGGVCILADKRLHSSTIEVNSSGLFNTVELVACRMKLGALSLHLSCVYFAPNLTIESFSNGIDCLTSLYAVV
jgi:hypothetical protein